VSDDLHWMPPAANSGGGTPDGAFVPPGAPAPERHPYGPSVQTPALAGSWTPPPKPGLIPLRPLTLGVILTASFQVLRRNPRPTFGFALGIQSIIMLLTLVAVGVVTAAAVSRVSTSSLEDSAEIEAGALVMILLSALIPAAFSMVAVALVQGILMLEIQRATLGEKLTLRRLWGRARGRLGALIGWMLLLTAALAAGIAVLVLIIVVLATLGAVGVALAVVAGIFGGLGLLAAAAWLGTKLSLVPSVLMGERLTLRQSVSRSWSLVDGYFWRTFGIQLLVSAMLGLAMQLVSVPLQLIAPLTVFLIDPNGTGGPVTVVVSVAVLLLSIVILLVTSSIATVVQSATTGLIYIDLRMRKEGLDLELARFVEQSGVGQNPPDPYLRGDRSSEPHSTAASIHPLPPPSESPWL
jgi:hypothetical protein